MTSALAVPMTVERARPKAKLLNWTRIAKSPPFGRFGEDPPDLLHPSADSLSVPLPESKVSPACQLITPYLRCSGCRGPLASFPAASRPTITALSDIG